MYKVNLQGLFRLSICKTKLPDAMGCQIFGLYVHLIGCDPAHFALEVA